MDAEPQVRGERCKDVGILLRIARGGRSIICADAVDIFR